MALSLLLFLGRIMAQFGNGICFLRASAKLCFLSRQHKEVEYHLSGQPNTIDLVQLQPLFKGDHLLSLMMLLIVH